ncbi:LuxR C-terminal-related transcriptional regulator [Rhizobium sp. Rhizsp82]|uniref:helix-turn-helix transcriptional regulator n=1 Tax=Rhizobium sp. Rhizsp82 TaxID=3243057 RepID=UPI0039B5A165
MEEDYPDLRSVPAQRRLDPDLVLSKLRKAVPFDYIWICGLDIPGFEAGTARSVDTDFPPLFVEKYVLGKFNAADPLILAAADLRRSLTDLEAYKLYKSPVGLQSLLADFNIYARAIVPVERQGGPFGAVIVARENAFGDDEMEYLEFVSPMLHRRITKSLMRKYGADQLRLSATELRCLALSEQGLTSEEIAKGFGLLPQTVNGHFIAAAKKLGANNRVQAVAIAIRRGLI